VDLTDNSEDRDIANALAAAKRLRDFDDLQAEMSGIDIGRQARFLKNGEFSEQAKADKRKVQERIDADMFYLALINNNQLGGYIANEVFDSKSDWQIFDIVTEIETKTGMRFEYYTAKILGAEAAQRMDGESDADYNRRVLKALADEMLEADGSIKAQYADEPLADIIRGDAAYQKIMHDILQINREGPSHEASALVAAYKNAGYASAELGGEKVNNDDYKGDLRDGQDGDRDSSTYSMELTSESDSFLDSSDAIVQAADKGKTQFNSSAVKPERADHVQTANLTLTIPKA